MKKIRAGLLGSTGAVGQRYISMLEHHPSIKLDVLMGGRSAGGNYGQSARWLQADEIPEEFAAKKVFASVPESARGCDVVFSALPAEAAAVIEPKFARFGFSVISEASSHRMDQDVPLVVPEVNPEQLGVIGVQKSRRRWKGSLVTTPNCTATGLVIVMKPLLDRFGLRRAIVTSMQAVSGAGFPGVPSLLITENVIPYIKNEEEKVAAESRKILSSSADGGMRHSEVEIAISCNRVPVIDGHTETLYGEFRDAVEPDEVADSLGAFRGLPQKLRLPSAPEQPIIVRDEPDRPQPRLDRLSGSVPGMSVVVGRVRRGIGDNSVQLTLLSHNTIRGAAGTAILTAELMQSQGYLGRSG